jgi:hypothetical protein
MNIHFPSKELVKGMDLKQTKEIGKFSNASGEIIVQDPSVDYTGSGVLLVKKKAFLEFLKKNGYEIIWAVVGEKLLLGTSGGGPDFLGRLEMGGAFRMKSDGALDGETYTKFLPPTK